MNLEDQITSDLKTALLSSNATAVSVLRLLKSELKNASIAQTGALDEAAGFQVIRREIKKRQDAAELYRKGGRAEQASQEEAEGLILEKYLPAQANPQEVETFIKQAIQEIPNPSAKNKGEIIKLALSKFGNQVDGRTVSEIVNRLLV